MDIFWILTLAIITGQLIRLPLFSGGISILDVTIIFLCLLGLTKLKLKLSTPPLFIIGALIFITIAVFSLLLSPLHLSSQEFLTSFLYTARFSFYVLFGWLVYSGAFPKFNSRIPKVILFSGLGLAIIGLLQFIFLPNLRFLTAWGFDPHYFRTVSTFLDPNFTGAYFVLTLVLLLSLRGSKVAALAVYLALLTTFSRSSYLMFLASGLTLSFLKRSKTIALVTLVLFAILLLGFQIYTSILATPRNIDRIQSATFRLNTWQQGWMLFRSHPILGVGFNAYRFAIMEYYLGDRQFLESHGAGSNDSSLLFVASTTGILGFTGYTFFLFSLLKESLRKNPVLLAGLSGLIIHSFFANSLFFPPILLWFILTSTVPKK